MKKNKYESPMCEIVEINEVLTVSLETDVDDKFENGGWIPEIDN